MLKQLLYKAVGRCKSITDAGRLSRRNCDWGVGNLHPKANKTVFSQTQLVCGVEMEVGKISGYRKSHCLKQHR